MKNIYNHDSYYLSDRSGKYDGLKSLFYFLLMIALLFSMLFLPDKIIAGDIKFAVQITDKAKLSGTLSGRFMKDFDSSELYIIAYSESGLFDMDKVFSLNMENNNPNRLVWKNQISMISAYNCIKAGGWASLSSIDFNPLKNQASGDISDFVFLLLLVKSGGDPLNQADWLDSAVTTIITDSSQRVPGQTQFVTDQSDNRYYPGFITDAAEDMSPNPSPEPNKDDDGSDVEKPDIYKISGNKLFYANGSAGKFQVVNITNPATPNLIHSESLQNTPLDLYITGNYVILLEQMSEQGNISVVLKSFKVEGDSINKAAEVAYPNMQYAASRKSGNRIFITGTVPYDYPYYTVVEDTVTDSREEMVEGGSLVSAVDISNPASPVLMSKKSLEGYDSDIYLNSEYLVHIARESWDTTTLHLFDLYQNDPLTEISQIKISGRVPSEYHVNISDNSLFVIYRNSDISKGSSLKIVEINTDNTSKEKGSVNGIAPGEELFAATFVDDRAYIVTYERKDPLWVVDIEDHSNPKIIGELEVPGWSEYIRFHNNRLVALGYDDSDGKMLVSVALFSVEDPLKPVLLDRVTPLSGVADYSYSVAIEDDRGFYWNPSTGIIMVPVSYYTDGNYSGLDIIHVDASWNSFKREDFVTADFNVQRGTEADASDSSDSLSNIALSMGDAALNTINISSEQKPVILGEIRLAYNVEKIALHKNTTSQEGITLGEKTLFALGGDFFTNGTSDLMRYDSKNGGQFDFTAPSTTKNTELLYPEILMDNGGFGLIFSWSSAGFRMFDQNSMTMGNIVKLGDTSTWSTSDPIFYDNHLYFAVSQYYYPKDDVIEYDDEYYIQDGYSINTSLKHYDCSDMNNPKQLSDISIPGTPKAIFNGTRLITVESYSYYYYPYDYAVRTTKKEGANEEPLPVDPIEPIVPPQDDIEIPEEIQGTRINAIELGQDSGVLDKTAFFAQETYGYSEVICDNNNIYLVSIKDDQTKIHVIDISTLNIVSSYDLQGSFSPVKAIDGRLLLTSRWYYPYWKYNYSSYMPYINSSQIKIVDVSGGALKEIATFSDYDIYVAKNNTVMENDGIYVASGYKGVIYLPFSASN